MVSGYSKIMKSTFLKISTTQIEAQFNHNNDEPAFLRTLIDTKQTKNRSTLEPLDLSTLSQLKDQLYPEVKPLKEKKNIENQPESILNAWTALEVLSPASFKKPQDLSAGDRSRVAFINDGILPWESNRESSFPNKRLYYHLILGTINLEFAAAKLAALYSDTRIEIPTMKGEAILASIILDKEGKPIGPDGITVSSFAWGVMQALSGNLSNLEDWSFVEHILIQKLQEIINKLTIEEIIDQKSSASLTLNNIQDIYHWLIDTLTLPTDLIKEPYFLIKDYIYSQKDSPDTLLLNSFFLPDLAKAKTLFKQQSATNNLKYYLGSLKTHTKKDLLNDKETLKSAVAPALFPPARWPGSGRHPLTLLQQAAVNLSINELKDNGILAVNGPPGTGKTTLLRDIVASIVTNRAINLAQHLDPAAAFINSNEKLKVGNSWIHLYKLDENIRGHEILVASSNNNAVENISKELPDISAITNDMPELTYFKPLSDKLLERNTWGLIAAVLGNSKNRFHFNQRFWWDEEVGMSTYLAAAAGNHQIIEAIDPLTREIVSRLSKIVAEESAPRDHDQALKRWAIAQNDFQNALGTSKKILEEYQQVHNITSTLSPLEKAQKSAIEDLKQISTEKDLIVDLLLKAQMSLSETHNKTSHAASTLKDYRSLRPSLLNRLRRTESYHLWNQPHKLLKTQYLSLKASLKIALTEVNKLHKNLKKHNNKEKSATEKHTLISQQLSFMAQSLDALQKKLTGCFLDHKFFEREHAERQKSAPWLNDLAQRARDDVFVKALALHKAFIDAAAKPLRHNLSALMNIFNGQKLVGASKQALLPDLWSSLFLVVPVISTTFASVDRMLGHLPPESLGWLLIDEAGQALPQAAIGAIMRTKRAVVVGDPIQIEPIVTLSDTLTSSICKHFNVDPNLYNAPAASVQTLADAATPYNAEFLDKNGSRTVGVPLLVHRRCSDPMFSISNAIAYNRLMVNAKKPSSSTIRNLLGPSQWFDVQGSFEEKWCPQEGELVLKLLAKLAQKAHNPDLFIITPFVVVQDGLRKIIRDSTILNTWTDNPYDWLNDRVGTVHVTQGREAEAVILVLGAPSPQQRGARNWAGGRPNLLNVAVTRAKEALYVIGNRTLWKEAGVFKELHSRLP